jgi:hypothetical protein
MINYSELIHFTPKLDYGKFYIYRLAERPALEVKLGWRQGHNTWVVRAQIDERLLVVTELHNMSNLFQELIKKRNDQVQQITYWTNCTDLE